MGYWKGDDYCDDGNNNAGCDWDGGDCCEATAPQGYVDTTYCTDCACLDPEVEDTAGPVVTPQLICSVLSWKGDGYCDDGNNNAGCDFDGGDCCAATAGVVDTQYCSECACLDPSAANNNTNLPLLG